MTRINTNVSALIAEQNLNNSNNSLQTTLTRLSTGLRINSAADDPAGMIASTDLGANISATNQAISNSQVATQMISTADSALSQISSLLTTINGLVTESANTSSESSSQLTANQLQIDSSLNAINSIAENTNFQGQSLLNGSLGFLTSGGAGYAGNVQNLQVTQANMGTTKQEAVNVTVTGVASQAKLTDQTVAGTMPQAQLSFAGGSVTINAPTSGVGFDNYTVKMASVASGTNGVTDTTPSASWDNVNHILTVTVANTGQTSATAIAAAISQVQVAGNNFTTSLASGVFDPTVDSVGAATPATVTLAIPADTADGTSGGNLTITAKTNNSAFNGTKVEWNTTGTNATPTATWQAGTNGGPGTILITVDGSANTTLAAIATAISTSSDTNVSNNFTASSTGAGTPKFDPNNAGDLTQVGALSNGTTTITDSLGNTINVGVTAKADGANANGMAIVVQEGANGTAATTASYDSTLNGGLGQLTITLANNAQVKASDIASAIANVNNVHGTFGNTYAATVQGQTVTTPATSTTSAMNFQTEMGTGVGGATAAVNGTAFKTATITLDDNDSGTPGTAAFQIQAKQWGTNKLNVVFTDTASGGPAVSAMYNAGVGGNPDTLTVNLNPNGTSISLATLETDINNAAGSAFTSKYQFTGNTTSGGALDLTQLGASGTFTVNGSALNATTTTQTILNSAAGSTTGVSATGSASGTIAVTDGTNTINLTVASNVAYTNTNQIDKSNLNNVYVKVIEGAAGQNATTASWDPTAGVSGTLTITLANNAAVTAAQIDNAIGALGSNFTNLFTASATPVGAGNPVVTPATSLGTPLNIADGATVGGLNNLTNVSGTLTGATVTGTFTGGSGNANAGLADSLVIEVGGAAGNQQFSFTAGTTAANMATAITQAAQSTGVTASANAAGLLTFASQAYGSNAFVNVNVVNEGANGTFGANLKNAAGTALATHGTGTDIQATVNNVAAVGSGNTVSMNTPSLGFSMSLAPTVGLGTITFNINGGGALFQLGADVTANQQARLGIQNVDTSSLGGTSGQLYQIGTGGNASLATNPTLAGQIVQEALSQITSLRGQLGAFQTATLDSNISTLTNTVTNLTAAQSDIQDADFASESASLTQQQILVQSGTTVLGIANSNPQNVLTLLQKASQV